MSLFPASSAQNALPPTAHSHNYFSCLTPKCLVFTSWQLLMKPPLESPAILQRGGVSSVVCLRVCFGSPHHQGRSLVPSSSQASKEGPQGKDHSGESQPQGSQSRDWRAPARGLVQRPEETPNGKAGDTWSGGRPIWVVVRLTLLPALIPEPTTSDLTTAKPLLFTTARAQPETRDSREEAPPRAAQSARPLPAPTPS